MSEHWETHYQSGETPWDKGEAAPGLVAFLRDHPLSGRVLVPGCGLGHDVRAIADANPDAQVVGLDLAPTAVEQADAVAPVAGESYREGDLFDLPSEFTSSFDWVWEHTCFCAIDPGDRAAYVDSVAGALKPGGQLVGVFYLNPYDEEHQPGEGPPHGVERAALEVYFGGQFMLREAWQPTEAYAGREGRELMMIWERKADVPT